MAVESGSKCTFFVTYFDGYLRIIEAEGFDNLLHSVNKDLEMAGRKIVILEERTGLLTESRGKDSEN